MATSLIRLPSERVDLLKSIASHRGVTVANLIGELAIAEAKRLGLTDIGLGMDISRVEEDLIFASSPVGNFEWPVAVALSVADTLEKMATVSGRVGGNFNIDAGISLVRQGTSIRIQNIEDGAYRAFAFPIALDIANLIREAAAETV